MVIAGGGIGGAAIFSQLAAAGYSALLVDRSDFGSSTSQASGMMIWGGLLYLTRFDLRTACLLSRDRDRLLDSFPHTVRPQYFRYLPLRRGWQLRPFVRGLLGIYSLLGDGRRGRSLGEPRFTEDTFIAATRYRAPVPYVEGMLNISDARFVLDLIRSYDSPECVPCNYMSLEGGRYDAARNAWRLELHDRFTGREAVVSARAVVNVAGTAVSALDARFGIASPYRHAYSKGVYLCFARPQGHHTPLIFELGRHRDVLCFVPWGPVSYWGPTETPVEDPAHASEPEPDDVRFLIEQGQRTFRRAYSSTEIVSYRCGVRALAVKAGYRGARYPLELSRSYRIHVTQRGPWISIYGGKFTSALGMSARVGMQLASLIGPPRAPPRAPESPPGPAREDSYPGLAGTVPPIGHCVANEYCLTLEDYLRRRTNIAQWVPRNGLGRHEEHLPRVRQLAMRLPAATEASAAAAAARYAVATREAFARLDAATEGLAP